MLVLHIRIEHLREENTHETELEKSCEYADTTRQEGSANEEGST